MTYFPDGTGVVEWTNEGGNLALLSTTRLPEQRLDELRQAITAGDISTGGFSTVEAPVESAAIYGDSCFINDNFVGVEVVVGNFAAQVAYVLDTDPTSVQENDGYAVIAFNRQDGSSPVNVRPVDEATWQRRTAESAGKSDQR